jgi:hypothetical protein
MAENLIVSHVQRVEFPEEYRVLSSDNKFKTVKNKSRLRSLCPVLVEGIIRIGGRLSRAEVPQHPAIIPADCHVSTLIVRHYHHIFANCGVDYVLSILRQRYWILRGRPLIKRLINSKHNGCKLCKRYSGSMSKQRMADLPPARVTPTGRAFASVGVDYFGPFCVKFKRGTTKRFGCIFTCLATRAVHFEVAYSLSTDSFLSACQRFTARRGKPDQIFSDNGTNLVAGSKELKKGISEWNQQRISDTLAQSHIQWSFNPPTASHMGGSWE